MISMPVSSSQLPTDELIHRLRNTTRSVKVLSSVPLHVRSSHAEASCKVPVL